MELLLAGIFIAILFGFRYTLEFLNEMLATQKKIRELLEKNDAN